jgi:hypothetical protein
LSAHFFVEVSNNHRDILLEATSSQIARETKVSSGDQGGEPTLSHWPQCYRIWNEIENFQIRDKNLYYALNNHCNWLQYNYNNFKVNFFCFVVFYEFIKFVVDELSHSSRLTFLSSNCTQFTMDRYLRCCL